MLLVLLNARDCMQLVHLWFFFFVVFVRLDGANLTVLLSLFWISVHMLPGRAIREHRKSREEEERKAGGKKGPLGSRVHGYQNRCQGTLPRSPFSGSCMSLWGLGFSWSYGSMEEICKVEFWLWRRLGASPYHSSEKIASRYKKSCRSCMGVVVKIMVPFGVPIVVRHLIFRVPKKGP